MTEAPSSNDQALVNPQPPSLNRTTPHGVLLSIIEDSLELGSWGLELPLKAFAFSGWHPSCSNSVVHSTFLQKVIICAVLGFLAAALVEWGRVFVEGADEALNGGYNKKRATDVVRP